MPDITRDQVLEQLKAVRGPEGGDIVSLGLVSDIVVSGAKVMFSITVPAEKAASLEPLRAAAEAAVRDLPGVEGAMVVLTAEKKGGAGAPGGATQPPRPAGTQAPPPRQQPAAAPPRGKAGIPGIDAIVAVASGKGGVGKSTTAVNLALALKANGLRVGILDADIYGPSLPRLLDLKDKKPEIISGRTLRALDAYGVKVMSIGFLVEEETPMIWRGPMVISALNQMMREVEWGDLDILVVDMPPGTGDAQLTMAQQVPLAGAIIVSTPQDLALIDARRGLAMFQRVDVPVLGIVENMSYFLCPHCGERTDIFSHGGARKEAETLGVPFLGEVPLDLRIRETSDAGTPIVASDPESPYAKVYREVATKVWDGIQRDRSEGGRPPPKIVIE
ncbi:Mrp/NBP35 family ATP-binding protein [Bauldia litoralis]|uniref:Mrp/NBP35 family ATP-binding protein n=1 Tax=Bauldia litoralis TaxID=665467 RepID=UPI0032661353